MGERVGLRCKGARFPLPDHVDVQHCWWRTDGVWSPTTGAKGIYSGCREISAPGQACVNGCGQCIAPTAPPAPFTPSQAANMNGEYVLSTTPNGPDANTKFPTNYKDYPGGVEYFDV